MVVTSLDDIQDIYQLSPFSVSIAVDLCVPPSAERFDIHTADENI